VSKFKKGDLIRCRRTHDKGLILDTHLPSGTPKVLWLTGSVEGLRSWSDPDYLVKMEDRGD
jgi:hypothetical protein